MERRPQIVVVVAAVAVAAALAYVIWFPGRSSGRSQAQSQGMQSEAKLDQEPLTSDSAVNRVESSAAPLFDLTSELRCLLYSERNRALEAHGAIVSATQSDVVSYESVVVDIFRSLREDVLLIGSESLRNPVLVASYCRLKGRLSEASWAVFRSYMMVPSTHAPHMQLRSELRGWPCDSKPQCNRSLALQILQITHSEEMVEFIRNLLASGYGEAVEWALCEVFRSQKVELMMRGQDVMFALVRLTSDHPEVVQLLHSALNRTAEHEDARDRIPAKQSLAAVPFSFALAAVLEGSRGTISDADISQFSSLMHDDAQVRGVEHLVHEAFMVSVISASTRTGSEVLQQYLFAHPEPMVQRNAMVNLGNLHDVPTLIEIYHQASQDNPELMSDFNGRMAFLDAVENARMHSPDNSNIATQVYQEYLTDQRPEFNYMVRREALLDLAANPIPELETIITQIANGGGHSQVVAAARKALSALQTK